MNSTNRAVIYTRISRDKNGQSLGVDRQEKACRELAKVMGLTVLRVFSDNDISAYGDKRRPDFEDMLTLVASGQVDTVLCWHPDRLYRRVRDLVRLFEAGPNLLIKSVQGGDIDLSNASGKMVATILASTSSYESEHLSERLKAAYVQRADMGVWRTGHRTFGYDRDGEPLNPEAKMFRKAVKDVLAGKSLRGIAREWNAAGVTTTLGTEWSSTRIRRILLSPRYAGIKTHNGKRVAKGQWTPLITEDTHEQVVRYLSDPNRIKVASFERKYVGSGIYRCGVCGSGMRVTFPGGDQPRKYTCSGRSCVMRTGDPVDVYVENAVLERLSRPDARLLVAEPDDDLAALQDRRAQLVAKYDELAQLLVDGTLDGPGARNTAAKLKADIAAIDAQLAAATGTSPIAALLATGTELRRRWDKLSPGVRAQIIDEVATVTIQPCPVRGKRGFDPDLVEIAWKSPA